ncbi:mitochondrial assembly of ribosomal large subunit protein 1 [Trichomycterus rosablanca]|uniref:mitochondrial assembly of ribosomal large subunit protein 1 n=1 Tax=Trichomycterus rosablanca TaxID=2290929 RepID=UPI002F3583C2
MKQFLQKQFSELENIFREEKNNEHGIVYMSSSSALRTGGATAGLDQRGVKSWSRSRRSRRPNLPSITTTSCPRALFHTDGTDVVTNHTARDSQSQHGGTVFSLEVLVSLLRQENAVDVCVIRVPEELKYTQYFIVVSGSSTRHLRAMAEYAVSVYKFLKKDGDAHTRIEGKNCEDWMCVDFGSMVVHFMLPETRERLDLETLWTLREYNQQHNIIPPHTLPHDFVLTHTHIVS